MFSSIQKIYSRWVEFVRLAWDSILAHRLRSFLTVVGVIIGVAVVATVASLLEGAGNFVNAQIATFAPDVVRVEKVSFLDFGGDGQAFAEATSKRPDLLPDDIAYLKDRFGNTIEIGAEGSSALPVRYGDKTLNGIFIQGVTPNITLLTNIKVQSGREFIESDDQFKRNVCIVGADIVDEFFPNTNPIGKEIRLGQLPYEIVGVAEPRGSVFGSSQDGFVIIPLGTFTRVFGERSRSLGILARAAPGSGMTRSDVEEAMRVAIRARHRLKFEQEDDFSIVTAKSVAAFASTLTGLIGTITYPLTIIALAVGGVVVMNMMLASVTERTREIGIRMALGARKRDILSQFLIEATLLTLLGGLIGLLLAFLIVQILGWATALPVYLPIWAVAMAMLVSCLVGIVFGVIPARQASKLDPIEALRSE